MKTPHLYPVRHYRISQGKNNTYTPPPTTYYGRSKAPYGEGTSFTDKILFNPILHTPIQEKKYLKSN